jgi:hypothetical protein
MRLIVGYTVLAHNISSMGFYTRFLTTCHGVTVYHITYDVFNILDMRNKLYTSTIRPRTREPFVTFFGVVGLRVIVLKFKIIPHSGTEG